MAIRKYSFNTRRGANPHLKLKGVVRAPVGAYESTFYTQQGVRVALIKKRAEKSPIDLQIQIEIGGRVVERFSNIHEALNCFDVLKRALHQRVYEN